MVLKYQSIQPTMLILHQQDFFNPFCHGVFLSNHAPRGALSAPPLPPKCVNSDRKMLLTWNLSQLYFNVTTKMVDKNFQNCSYRDDDVTNYVNFFEKLCEKWLKYVFSKIDLVAAGKKISKIFFHLLKVNITQIEHI